MAWFEGLLGFWPMLLMVSALPTFAVGVFFLANKKRAQRQLAELKCEYGPDVTDPQNSPARAAIAATVVDYHRHAGRTSREDEGDSGSPDGGSDGGGGD